MPRSATAPSIDAIRRFNRFYTQRIGALNEGLLRSPFSLTEARILYELAHRETPTASDLRRDLGLDAGYLSRILRDFARRRLVERLPSDGDRRRRPLRLTAAGRRAFSPLDARSRREVGALLAGLPPHDQRRLVSSMQSIETILDGTGRRSLQPDASYLLRAHRPGDIGWVVHRHGAVYAEEYGWDESFEALVAEIAAKFIRNFDAQRECCWVAERAGEIVGSVFLVRHSPQVAQLRLLLVEPQARGLGIGARLVEECVRFARRCGYRKVTLWTQSILLAARHIYAQAGFRLVRRERHRSFGQALVGEYWELVL